MSTRRDLEWQDDAICAQVDPGVFFVEHGGNASRAKSICDTCPVKTPCLEYALVTMHPAERDGPPSPLIGVWGGTTEQERRRLRAGRAA